VASVNGTVPGPSTLAGEPIDVPGGLWGVVGLALARLLAGLAGLPPEGELIQSPIQLLSLIPPVVARSRTARERSRWAACISSRDSLLGYSSHAFRQRCSS
jgi:hypothetical protein